MREKRIEDMSMFEYILTHSFEEFSVLMQINKGWDIYTSKKVYKYFTEVYKNERP